MNESIRWFQVVLIHRHKAEPVQVQTFIALLLKVCMSNREPSLCNLCCPKDCMTRKRFTSHLNFKRKLLPIVEHKTCKFKLTEKLQRSHFSFQSKLYYTSVPMTVYIMLQDSAGRELQRVWDMESITKKVRLFFFSKCFSDMWHWTLLPMGTVLKYPPSPIFKDIKKIDQMHVILFRSSTHLFVLKRQLMNHLEERFSLIMSAIVI